jgi:hypothetical protein
MGRFINADAIGGNVGALLSHNIFAYCNNNPVTAQDPSGFRPIYTTGEETYEMRGASYEAMNKFYANKSISTSSGSNSLFSWFKAGATGLVDNIGSSAGKKFINTGYRKVCEVKALGPAFRVSVAGESLSKSLGKKALGHVGDIGVGAYSARDSFKKGEVAGGFIDLGATAVGIWVGGAIEVGVAALMTASAPVWAVAGVTFIATTAVTVVIDWGTNKIKDNIYGR